MATGGGNQLNAVLVFGGDAKGAVNAINTLNTQLGTLNKKIGSVNRQTKSSVGAAAGAGGFGGLGSVITSVVGTIQRFVDGFRLITQGLMSAGRALTFFISIPLLMFLKQGFQAAVEFEDQMVRVAKVTDLPTRELIKLEEQLRQIARTSPTTHKQLGIMAEQAGQLGVSTAKGIGTFVRWMEILSTSTNIAADDVIKTMGKISAAFGWNIDESADNIIRLANVMNELENSTAATAGEIADALFRFAPVANQLDIAAADAAALAAALISVGVSSESTGTRLGTMYVKLTQNTEKFAELAAQTDKYSTKADVLNAINEDAVQVLQDLISMMAASDDRAGKLAAAFDLVGLRGGRALGALASGEGQLSNALTIARLEWEQAQSLVAEYNRQLESTQSHLDIMRNNVTDVAIQLGQTLLPAINDLIELLIPAVRRITEFVKSIQKTRPELIMFAALIAVAVVAIGPILFLLSQIAFGFNMVVLGLIKFIGVFTGVGAAIGKVLVGLWNLKFWAFGFVGALAALGAVVLKILQNMGYDIAGFFKDLASRATAWGANLSANIANGLLAGAVKYIAKAITAIANMIASFLEGHSPPDVGPLSHIDRWGEALIDTYLKSMTKADFSILSKVGRTIEKIFSTFAAVGIVGEKNQFKLLLKARQDLAKLLAIWNKTGTISERVLNDVVKNLRSAKEEVKKLITLELTLLGIEKALDELARRRTETQESYASSIDEIAASGKSAEERVDLIRQAMRARNDELKAINKEEDALEKQKTVAEEQLETQRAMIDAMQDQDDIQAKLIDTLKDLAGALGDMGGFELPELGTVGSPPDPEDIWGEIGEPILELEIRIKSKEGIWDSFLAGLRGEGTDALMDVVAFDVPMSERGRLSPVDELGIAEKDVELFYRMNEIGQKIHDTYQKITTTIDTLSTSISDIFSGGIEMPEGATAAWDSITETWDKVSAVIRDTFEPAIIVLKTAWDGFVKSVTPSIERFRKVFDKFAKSGGNLAFFNLLVKVLGLVGKAILWMIQTIATGLSFVIGILSAIVAVIINFILGLVTTIMEIFNIFSDDSLSTWEKIKAALLVIVSSLVSMLKAQWDTLVGYLQAIWGTISEGVINFFTNLYNVFKAKIMSILAWWTVFKFNMITKFYELKEQVISAVIAFFANLISQFVLNLLIITVKIALWIADKVKRFAQLWEDIKTGLSTKWEEIKEAIGTKIEEIKTAFRTWADELKERFQEWAGGWLTAIEEGVKGGIEKVAAAFEGLVNRGIEVLQPLINVIQSILNFVKNPPSMPTIKVPKIITTGVKALTGKSEPEFATGGIVTTRMKAIVGDVPEAIIPLTKLPSLINRINSYSGDNGFGGGGINLNLTFEIGSVDSQATADRLAEEVIRKVEDSINTGMSFGVGYR